MGDLDEVLRDHKAQSEQSEHSGTQSGQPIVFADLTPDCFRFLREYFYSLNPLISLQNIADIFYAADKLKIGHLLVAAKQFIDECADINDLVLALSQLHARKLYAECDRIIANRHLFEGSQAIKVFRCENLKTMPTELMIRLLRYNSTQMAEETIFERCTTWAEWKEKVAIAENSEEKSISLVTTEEAHIDGWDDEQE